MSSVYISNRFALLSGAPSKQPPPKALKDNKAVSEAKQLVAAEVAKQDRAKKVDNEKKSERDGDKQARGNSSNRGRGGDRGRGGADRGGRGGAPRGDRNVEGGAPRGERKQGDRPYKPRREDGDAPRERGRKLDRRPGTGRPVNEEKKTGHGKGNWGSITETVEAEKDLVIADNAEGTTPAAANEPAVEPAAPEPPTLSLAEFEKLQKENQAKFERPPPRVVEEDEVLKSKYTKLERKDNEPGVQPGKAKKNKEKAQNVSKKNVVPLTTVLDVKPPPRDGDRAYKGKGKGPQSGKKQGNSNFTYSADAFPSLG